MTSVANFYHRQSTEPDLGGSEGLTRLSTTLYDVITELQTMMEPDKDYVVVAVITHWIRSGRLCSLRCDGNSMDSSDRKAIVERVARHTLAPEPEQYLSGCLTHGGYYPCPI
jgi:hypothetical protein